MSKVIKIQPAQGENGSASGLGRKAATLADREEFLSFEDLWLHGGTPAGRDEGGVAVDPREQARAEAEEILAQARVEAEKVLARAREEGLASGREQGLAQGKQEYAERLSRLEQLLEGLARERARLLSRYRQEILTLVQAMVDRLVFHEVSVNPAVIEACLGQAMEYVVENSRIQVHLHGDDLERLKAASLENPALLTGKGRVQLIEDSTISQGGCLLETSFGEIDATLENRRHALYQAVEEALLSALAAEPEEGAAPAASPEGPEAC